MFFCSRITTTSKQSHTLLVRGFSITHHVLRGVLPPTAYRGRRHWPLKSTGVAALALNWGKIANSKEEPKDIAQDLRGETIRDLSELCEETEEKPRVARSGSIKLGDSSSQSLPEPQAPFSQSTKARPNLIEAASGGPLGYYATSSEFAKGKPIRPSPSQKNRTARKMAPLGGDKKVQPSSASGGIPNPTSQYLDNTNESPRMAANPRHLLVVIDLNGTLLYRPNRKLPTKFTPRPHAQKFLEYCVDTFTVVIWSSARQENVEPMCQTILTPRLRQKVVAIWGRESFNLSPSDYNMRVQCYKRLTALWTDPGIAASHPDYARGGRWDQTNTVLIDDSSEKARSEPFNLVEIPEFFGDHKEVGDILPQVHDYLNFLSLHENVSATIRNQPFRARAGNPHEAVGLDLPLQNPGIRSSANQ
ncbi:phospho phosphatase protein [Rutstroemia sp. NJR-2017a BVV2]|nr:phospho phosphatase protein [Rutstroemia sp. NJR-2017a BVV2]